ncbi:hypothetical protein C0995_002502 [Termitomyces sp. Mi166|nr:hypothetical protein C0995_002502 [Termitomyces sp. Mi166\
MVFTRSQAHMQSHPVFPLETFSIILEQVPYSNNPQSIRKNDSESAVTLVNCSLVSSSFRDIAQRRLFKDVTVELPSFSNGSTPLNEILSSSARLRTFVVKLRLVIYPKIITTQDEFHLDLPNLVDLWITGGSRAPFDWKMMLLTKAYESKLYTLMRGPALSRLMLRHINNFPISALNNCGQLKELCVKGVGFDNIGTCNILSPMHPTYLETMDLSDDCNFPELVTALIKPSSSLSIARLRKLSLDIFNEATCTALKMALDEAGAYLDDLELVFHRDSMLLLT